MHRPKSPVEEQLNDAARAFAVGALEALDPAAAVDEASYSGSGVSSYDRVGLFQYEMFRVGKARRAAFERCEDLARRSRLLRHARAA